MMKIWGMTDIGRVRKENQDAYAVRVSEETGHTICVVCDGMGGPGGGRLASTLAVETFLDACQGNLRPDMDAQAVRQVADFAVAAANRAVYQRSQTEPGLKGMGTTLVSAVIWGDQALISNVGDSRAYLIRPEEGISRQSRLGKMSPPSISPTLVLPEPVPSPIVPRSRSRRRKRRKSGLEATGGRCCC